MLHYIWNQQCSWINCRFVPVWVKCFNSNWIIAHAFNQFLKWSKLVSDNNFAILRAYIIKEQINSFRTGFIQCFLHWSHGLVVDSLIKSQSFEILYFFIWSSKTWYSTLFIACMSTWLWLGLQKQDMWVQTTSYHITGHISVMEKNIYIL